MQHVCFAILSIIAKQKLKIFCIMWLLVLSFICCSVLMRSFLEFFAPEVSVDVVEKDFDRPLIIAITPTHRRTERIADLTRLSQTLSLIEDLHWVVVEDANWTYPYIENILKRSKLPYHYLNTANKPGESYRGWTQRNLALSFIRDYYGRTNAVVYFCDDDNAYDYRVFDNYIRKVKRIGIWAVGLVGSAMVEAPRVRLGQIVGWDVVYEPRRLFATDMAGFAVNLREIQRTNASFRMSCAHLDPEICFLMQFSIPAKEIEPFGYNDSPKEVLVWHTKTMSHGTKGSEGGYLVERNRWFSIEGGKRVWHE